MDSVELGLLSQVQCVFEQLEDELSETKSGIVFIQLRNNTVGKFGIKHKPIHIREGRSIEPNFGLNENHRKELTNWAMNVVSFKRRGWTHGEMQFEFSLVNGSLHTNILYESNYNMAAVKTV